MAKKIPIEKKAVIKTARKEKPYFQEIRAVVIGDFAFHRTIEKDGSGSLSSFTVTHVPSGLSVVQTIRKQKTARGLTQMLARLRTKWQPELPRWENKGILTEDYSQDFEKKVKKTVRKFRNQIR